MTRRSPAGAGPARSALLGHSVKCFDCADEPGSRRGAPQQNGREA